MSNGSECYLYFCYCIMSNWATIFALLHRISVIKRFTYRQSRKSRLRTIIPFVEMSRINVFEIDRCIYIYVG